MHLNDVTVVPCYIGSNILVVPLGMHADVLCNP